MVSLRKSIASIGVGTVVGQLVGFAVAPIVARLYAADDFGVLGAFSSWAMIFGAVATLRYALAIPVAKSGEDAEALVRLSMLVATILSLAVGAGLVVLSVLDGPIAGSGLGQSIWLLPPAIFAMAAYTVARSWAGREHAFAAVAKTKIGQSLAASAIQIGAGLVSLGSVGLVASFVIGQSAGYSTLHKNSHMPRWWRRASGTPASVSVARRYWDFVKFGTPAALLGMVGTQIPPIMLLQMYGAEFAGWYAFAHRLLVMPVTLVGQSVSQVLFPVTGNQERSDSERGQIVLQIAIALTLLSLPMFTAIAIVGPEFFALVFGESWRTSGEMARPLSIWLALSLVSSPLSPFAIVKDRQRASLWIVTAETTTRLLALATAFVFGDGWTAVWGYCLASASISLIYTFWILHLADVVKSYLRAMTAPICLWGLALGCSLAIMNVLEGLVSLVLLLALWGLLEVWALVKVMQLVR